MKSLAMIVYVVAVVVLAAADGKFTGIPQSKEILIRVERDGTNEGQVSRSFAIALEPGDTLVDLKRRITELEGLPYLRQQLYLPNGTLLSWPWQSLDEYNIDAAGDGWLKLVIDTSVGLYATEFGLETSPEEPSMRITMELSQTVASLKVVVAQRLSGAEAALSSTPGHRLLLNGKELRDERQLVEYSIWNHTVIQLGAPLEAIRRRSARIRVKTLSGATYVIEDVDLSETVAHLKERIEQATGAARQVQMLLFRARILHDVNRLCDYGLDPSSSVHLLLYSRLVQSAGQANEIIVTLADGRSLQASSSVNRTANDRAPVLREQEAADSATANSIMRDERVWVFGLLRPTNAQLLTELFDPMIKLRPDPDSQSSIVGARVMLQHMALGTATRLHPPGHHEALRARLQIALILRAHRSTSDDKSSSQLRPVGIDLGAAAAGELGDPPLGADLNNYAPDSLDDTELVSLFAFAERVRDQRTSDARTGQGNLSPAKLRFLNKVVFRAYVESMAGYARAQEDYRESAADEECSMCRDELALERALRLTSCGHTFHEDCLVQWLPQMYEQSEYTNCPYCSEPTRLHLATIIKGIELDRAKTL